MTLGAWRVAGRTTDYRGHSIFVTSAGDAAAEPLLLIHGFPTGSWDWHAVWPALASRYRAYALDLIGFGFSAKPREYSYSIVDQADLCESFLEAEGVLAYHVLAHDLGDSVAQELLARQGESGRGPELLSVAFLNGGLFPETHRPALIQRLLQSPIGSLVAKLSSRETLARNMRRIFGPETQPSDELIDGFWSLLTTGDGQAVVHKLVRYMAERRTRRERWVGALQAGRVPLKLIDGVADPISGRHMVERFRELVAHGDVTELPRIGHYPQLEAPRAVLDAYLAWNSFRSR